MFNSSDIADIINVYKKQNIDDLSSKLNTADRRIKFEEWLLQDKTLPHDLSWQIGVITLISKKIKEDKASSLKSIKVEDTHLANLIARVDFSSLEHPVEKHYLNVARILKEVKSAQLETSSAALFNKMKDQPDFDFTKAFNNALKEKDSSLLQILAYHMPTQFNECLSSSFNEICYFDSQIEKIEYLTQAVPAAFETFITTIGSSGITPVRIAAENKKLDVIKLMSENFPKAFNSSLLILSDDRIPALYYAVQENNLEMVKLFAQSNPAAVSRDLTYIEYIDGNTPLHIAAKNNNIEMFKLFSTIGEDGFKKALKHLNHGDRSPLNFATKNDNLEICKILAEFDPEFFEESLSHDDSPISRILSRLPNLEWLQLYMEKAPQSLNNYLKTHSPVDFIFNLIEQGNFELLKRLSQIAPEGFTPIRLFDYIHRAIGEDNIKVIEKLLEFFPESSHASLTLLGDEYHDPLMLTVVKQININVRIFNQLTQCNPKGLEPLDKEGYSVLSILKSWRPKNYRELLQIIKSNTYLKQHQKALIQRKKLGHAWHISGTSKLIEVDTQKTRASLDLTGHPSPEWYHQMDKDLTKFQSDYPDLLDKTQIRLLKDIYEIGANASNYSPEQIVKLIQSGQPVVLNTGFYTHAVTVLIWGDQFVICNRGGASRRPIEVYHFNPAKFDVGVLKDIQDCWNKQATRYRELFFTELPKKLEFHQTDVDIKMEEAYPLPHQTVGNCSFASSTTADYAFFTLGSFRRVDNDGKLLNETPNTENEVKARVKKAVDCYQAKLSHLQLSFLEKSILPLEQGKSAFLPDHKLIVDSLEKAHIIPLDDHAQKRLDDLTTKYINSLDESNRTEMKTRIAFWKMLKQVPLPLDENAEKRLVELITKYIKSLDESKGTEMKTSIAYWKKLKQVSLL